MAFMGTMVSRGNGIGIIVAYRHEYGNGENCGLASNSGNTGYTLQRRLEQLGKNLNHNCTVFNCYCRCYGDLTRKCFYTMFLAGVSLAVAAIPEGLPAIVTVALSLGVQRMIKKMRLFGSCRQLKR